MLGVVFSDVPFGVCWGGDAGWRGCSRIAQL